MRRLIAGALLGMGAVALLGAASASGNDGPTCFGKPATIIGSGTITGTPGKDVIVGSNGDDVIEGLGGNDRICSLDGVDRPIGASATTSSTPARATISPQAISGRLTRSKPTGGMI